METLTAPDAFAAAEGGNQISHEVGAQSPETCTTIMFDAIRVIFGSAWTGYRDAVKSALNV